MLVLDQSDGGPFYHQLFSGLRTVVGRHDDAHVTMYNESLDLSRFSGQGYEETLKRYLKEKYQDKQIGAIVSVGAVTTGLILKWRDELWPGIPVVFAMLDEMDVAQLKPPSDVTGIIVKLPLANAIKVARIAVPDLDTIVLIGDDWHNLVVYRNWADELPTAAAGLRVIQIVGKKMTEIREQVTNLPARSAIIYSAVFGDGEGTFYPPFVALGMIAEKANRPIVVAAETFLAPGGIGGYVLVPAVIGEDAGDLRCASSTASGPRRCRRSAAVCGRSSMHGRWSAGRSATPACPKAAKSASASHRSSSDIDGRAWLLPPRCCCRRR